MDVISISSPSMTLDCIVDMMQSRYESFETNSDQFSVCNLGMMYIFRHDNMFITCYNYFEMQKQFVVVVSYFNNAPYIWFADFLEDSDV